jgi:hypothetical protein
MMTFLGGLQSLLVEKNQRLDDKYRYINQRKGLLEKLSKFYDPQTIAKKWEAVLTLKDRLFGALDNLGAGENQREQARIQFEHAQGKLQTVEQALEGSTNLSRLLSAQSELVKASVRNDGLAASTGGLKSTITGLRTSAGTWLASFQVKEQKSNEYHSAFQSLDASTQKRIAASDVISRVESDHGLFKEAQASLSIREEDKARMEEGKQDSASRLTDLLEGKTFRLDLGARTSNHTLSRTEVQALLAGRSVVIEGENLIWRNWRPTAGCRSR